MVPPVAIQQALGRMLLLSSQFHGSWSCSHATYKFMCDVQLCTPPPFSRGNKKCNSFSLQMRFPAQSEDHDLKVPTKAPLYTNDTLFSFPPYRPQLLRFTFFGSSRKMMLSTTSTSPLYAASHYFITPRPSMGKRTPSDVGGYLNEIVIISPPSFVGVILHSLLCLRSSLVCHKQNLSCSVNSSSSVSSCNACCWPSSTLTKSSYVFSADCISVLSVEEPEDSVEYIKWKYFLNPQAIRRMDLLTNLTLV